MDELKSTQQDVNSEPQQRPKKTTNRAGVTGFILALLGFLLCWIPGLNILLWLLGLIFSIVGICKTPRTFAAVGIGITCISIWLILLFSTSYLLARRNQQAREALWEYLDCHIENDTKQPIEYVEITGKKGPVTLYIGIPKDSVRMLVGKPDEVDLRTVGSEVREDWGYKIKNKYASDLDIGFIDGRLKSIDQY